MKRRSALARIGGLLMGLIGTVLSAPAVLYLLDPVRRRRQGQGAAPAVPLGRLKDVPDLDRGERPLRATVTAKEQRDAWNRFPSVKLGAVWLYRKGGELRCLSTVCPHAGCSIDYDDQRGAFACPCHNSTFTIDGARKDGPSPRDMDQLDTEIKDGEVLCHYRRYRLAVGKKEPV